MAEGRKSGRRRQPTKKYHIDPFEGLELDEDLTENPEIPQDLDDSDKDAAFEVDPSADVADDNLSVVGDLDDDDPTDGSDAEELLIEDEESILDEELDVATAGTQRGPGSQGRPMHKSKLSSRGLLAIPHRGAKQANRRLLFGPELEDQGPAFQAHFKWRSESTLPTHKVEAGGFGGFNNGYYRSESERKREMEEDWKWYDDQGGQEDFAVRQALVPIDASDAASYLPSNDNHVRSVMGPYNRQELFELVPGTAMNLNDAWKSSSGNGDDSAQDPKSRRHGWMLNVGQKVQCLDWAPNQYGKRQYLAVSTAPLRGYDNGHPRFEAPKAPAYTAQPPHKSCIQIWEFHASENNAVDPLVLPKLRQVICTEWSDIKSLQWCPVPRKDKSATRDAKDTHLGLIAAVCGDGAVRVLDISVSALTEAPTAFLRCNSPVFQSQPPHTIFTCVTWLSSTGLAAGCANGCVAIWNLPSSVRESNDNPSPLFFSALQSSYILEITSCYPSRPQMLLTTSMSGHLSMTDLTDISSATGFSPVSTILSARHRIGRSVLVWHDWSQMAVTIDDTNTLCAYPLRRFHGHVGMTRFKAPSMAVAVSPVHPFVMVGCTNGDCTANNPMHRVVNVKATMWNQTWFSHEFRPTTETEEAKLRRATTGANDGSDEWMREQDGGTDGVGKDGRRSGVVRIMEGFKPESIKLSNNEDAQVTGYTSVYELESSVTRVAWNPNVLVGGWVAAGTASGLLRVEDVAV